MKKEDLIKIHQTEKWLMNILFINQKEDNQR